jgi:ABC-type multidrug transport system fused ATPase/permease subunit
VTVRRLGIWPILFWAVIAFQISVLPDTLGVGLMARAANSLALVLLFVCSISVLASQVSERVLVLYCLPIVLIIVGYLTNVLRSANLEALSYLGLIIPWFAALSVPFTKGFDAERYWRLFHGFMLVASIIALLEYVAVFWGFLQPSILETKRGEFLKGFLTIFLGLEDGTPYNRMYGVFVQWEARRRGAVVSLFVALAAAVTVACVFGTVYEFFANSYLDRGESAAARESNIDLFFRHFFDIAFEDPLGMKLHGDSLTELAKSDRLYIGSNFTIGNALVVGGLTSFIGYVVFLLVNTVCWLRAVSRTSHSKVMECVCVSFPAVLSFIVQRATIFDSALYSFLFAVPILSVLRRGPADTSSDIPLPGLTRSET